MADTPYLDELALAWEEEGLFARDVDGQLVRLERATEADYRKLVTLVVDGREVTVPKAAPLTDSQGNIVNDADGRTIPRRTTIYDAATRRYVRELGDENPIPILCHREHMRPAGVCRVCAVEVSRMQDGREVKGRKLVPACHHPVDEVGMIVHTLNSPDQESADRVRQSVRILLELLTADHLREDGARQRGSAAPNELAELARRVRADPAKFRFRTPPERGGDDSSQLIVVNHNECILCERCMRACNEVKQNNVVGRSSKGYAAHIAFDLNNPLGYSSCVSCGECMVSCPTGALTFNEERSKQVKSPWWNERVSADPQADVSADELRELHPLFRSLPYKFLQWNAGAVVRRRVKHGEVLCRQGDYGATAFILLSGEYAIFDEGRRPEDTTAAPGGLRGLLGGFFGGGRASADRKAEKVSLDRTPPDEAEVYRKLIAEHGEPATARGRLIGMRDREDLILGEMTCMSDYPRTATVTVIGPGELLEIRRNVLYVLQRNPQAREMLDRVYRERAIETMLRPPRDADRERPLFAELSPDERKQAREFLRDRVRLVRVDPGQIICRQGEAVDDFYLVRIGYVKVSQTYYGQERVLDYLGPDRQFGEIGLAATMPELQAEIGDERLSEETWGRRTATCSALDDVELLRICGEVFRTLVKTHGNLRRKLVARIQELLQKDVETRATDVRPLGEFLDQGLFNAQKLLVLDLERCTRCDECTKACADTHGGVTRLVREGLRFGKYLVASACRSCTDPYCLVGCPVDAIHREDSLEIIIEQHCIGCGLCANNCPYGNINMHPHETQIETDASGARQEVVRQAATTCDLCREIVPRGS
ncbi:MAG: cyclic nucleotide-binding domain-containing protein, partial [Planctomycetes bacterium]|nr:cyclic nucleotide-binding domain-containing protein [Planctomycetota bacterium]